MTRSTDPIVELEARFLAGMEHNFERAKGTLLRGSHWDLVHQDEADRVRSLMARNRKFDRRVLADTPKNRRVVLHGYVRPWWWFGKRRVGVAIASVLSPLEWHVLDGQPGSGGPPIGSSELLDHVRSLQVDPHVPHIIGICSPTGFAPEALRARSSLGNVTLVLIQPGAHGGWERVGDTDDLDPRLAALFDPEDEDDKVQRVDEFLQANRAVLLTGGLSAESVAREVGVGEEYARRAFEQAARRDPELHTGRHEGAFLIYRGAASDTQESFSMSMVDKIRQLFSSAGDEARKINELSRRRAALSQRRDRMYDDIAQLETREASLIDQGKQSTSQVVRQRLAAQVAQLRKDLARQNATANMLNKQINILSTDIHNLTLIQQGELADLPATEALTENAVKAEEMLETLKADADLVGSLETGISDMLTSDEELAILQEFDQPPAEASATTAAEGPAAAAEPPARTADPADDSPERRRQPREPEPS